MAITRSTLASIITAHLNQYASATNIVILEAANNPTSVANINSNTGSVKLADFSGITAGIGNGDYTESTINGKPCLVTPASEQLIASGSGTPSCYVLHDGTNILHIEPYIASSIASGEPIKVLSFNIIFNQ